MHVVLNPVTESDVDAYIQLELTRDNLLTYKSLTGHDEALEQIKTSRNYFIQDGGNIVGSISYKIIDDETAEIDGVLVRPESEGKGYAKAALKLLLPQLNDYTNVFLMTHPDNPRSIHLYSQFGFNAAGRIENYFGDGEPRLKMILKRADPHI